MLTITQKQLNELNLILRSEMIQHIIDQNHSQISVLPDALQINELIDLCITNKILKQQNVILAVGLLLKAKNADQYKKLKSIICDANLIEIEKVSDLKLFQILTH